MKSGSGILIAYLVAHGAIKLGLVYCLLRRWHRAYPVALVVLGAFLAYQLYLLIVAPTVLLAAFSLLDAGIIFLVYKEYREVKGASASASAR